MAPDVPPPGDGSTEAFSVVKLSVLKQRADFLRAARAQRKPMPGFILQARRRGEDEAAATPIRIGYTCSKKVGNAVARNRAKRRLREIARSVLPVDGRAGWDYVLVGRTEVTATLPFAQLEADLAKALRTLHR
jgi:ribonuclease P protein component